MSLYLNPKLVECAFRRLVPSDSTGKSPKERTSALMYFLAFVAAVKKLDCCPLDLDPGTTHGKNNRSVMGVEFAKLVLLKASTDRKIRQVCTLGQVEISDTEPEKRISSNFYTVPLKKASESAKANDYPHRPAAPLLKMGQVATGLKWGISYHDAWRENIQKFFTEIKSNTPFTDLAIFVFRNECLPGDYDNVRDALSCNMQERFGADVATFWTCRMDNEKVFFKHGNDPFCSTYHESLTESEFSAVGGASDRDALQALDKAALIDRVTYLEDLLAANDIEY